MGVENAFAPDALPGTVEWRQSPDALTVQIAGGVQAVTFLPSLRVLRWLYVPFSAIMAIGILFDLARGTADWLDAEVAGVLTIVWVVLLLQLKRQGRADVRTSEIPTVTIDADPTRIRFITFTQPGVASTREWVREHIKQFYTARVSARRQLRMSATVEFHDGQFEDLYFETNDENLPERLEEAVRTIMGLPN